MKNPAPGIYTAQHASGARFKLSVMRDRWDVLCGVAPFRGARRPRRGAHLLLTANVRTWLADLTLKKA